MKLTIQEAAQKAAIDYDSALMRRVLNKMSVVGNPQDIALICDINSVGLHAHNWAWDQLEQWQIEGE